MDNVNFDLTFKEQFCSSIRNGKEIKIMVKKIEDTTDDNRKADLVESKEFKEKQENLNHKYSLKTIK